MLRLPHIAIGSTTKFVQRTELVQGRDCIKILMTRFVLLFGKTFLPQRLREYTRKDQTLLRARVRRMVHRILSGKFVWCIFAQYLLFYS